MAETYTAVSTMKEFTDKYGVRGVSLIVDEFIARSPHFQGREKLVELLSEVVTDLERAIRSYKKEE